MFEIEKNVPAPERSERAHGYNFSEMKVGDSVFFPDSSYENNRPLWAAKKYFVRNKKKITSRKENGGIRIWRIE